MVAHGVAILGVRKIELAKISLCVVDRELGDLPNRLALDFDRLGALVEPAALASRARYFRHQLIELAARVFIARLPKLFQIRHEADESTAAAAAVEDFLLKFFRLFGEGFVDVDIVLVFELGQQALHRPLHFGTVHRRARRDAAQRVPERLARIGKNQFGIEIPSEAHAGALAASALLAVERKKPRIERLVADAAAETEKSLIEDLLAALGNQMDHAVAQTQPLIDQQLRPRGPPALALPMTMSMLCSLKRSKPLVSSGARRSINLPSMRARR